MRRLVLSIVLLCGIANRSSAQVTLQSVVPPLSDSLEIALALSAAPAEVSSQASVYGVRDGRIVVLRVGKSGAACMVSRDSHPEALYPECFSPEAARTLMQRELFQLQLRSKGRSERDVRRLTKDALATGRLKSPRELAVIYMMSPNQVLYSAPDSAGRRVGAWWPHLMISNVGLERGRLGLAGEGSHAAFSLDEEEGVKQFVVKVPYWSDGTRVP